MVLVSVCFIFRASSANTLLDSPRHTEYRNVFLMACAEFTTPDGLFQILSRRFFDEEMNENAERRVIMQYKYVSPSSDGFF